jgi:hypothetical protein
MRFGDFAAFIKYAWIFVDRATGPNFSLDFLSEKNILDGT